MILQRPQGMCKVLLTLPIIVTVNPVHMLVKCGLVWFGLVSVISVGGEK